MPVSAETILNEFVELLDETFDHVHGHYLDRGTSLFETIDAIPAAEASVPSPANGETIAAHIYHVRFYIDVIREYIQGTRTGRTDWNLSWVVKSVDERAWGALKSELRRAYDELLTMIKNDYDWSDEDRFGGVLSAVTHTAFHLGSIRQLHQHLPAEKHSPSERAQ